VDWFDRARTPHHAAVWRSREFLEHWTPRLFAGSLLDLEPDTEYERDFEMVDPDGLRGDPRRRATASR
jgi:hypothetical protein